jgi:hypothetical protein
LGQFIATLPERKRSACSLPMAPRIAFDRLPDGRGKSVRLAISHSQA